VLGFQARERKHAKTAYRRRVRRFWKRVLSTVSGDSET
jgi:hypothetical protein